MALSGRTKNIIEVEEKMKSAVIKKTISTDKTSYTELESKHTKDIFHLRLHLG